jgi:two-component SAPR family response regulator
VADILIIDDEPFVEELISEQLADEGHHIRYVGDADYVMSFVKESRPDIILLDLYLQGFEGWDLLKKIKAHDASLPVVIVSAYDNFISDPRLANADGYVIKDLNTDKLKEKIHEKLAIC